MAFYINVLDKLGNFEIIDGDLAAVYPHLDFTKLTALTDEQYTQFCHKSTGKVKFINGQFVSEDIKVDLTLLLSTKRDSFIEQIDNHAAKIYSTWTRFESEYRERQAAAEAYKSTNYQGECSRYITDFAQRARLDNKTATNLILTQAAGLEKLQMELANQRMRKYELQAPNLTLEQLQSIHDDIIKQMDNLMEAYQNG
ncbi:hypothetical protein [Haemophilus parainfluenzae]|uniref:hypothetical protein n=1 Tax=Haemophilus parainfluenzae TaxID=729 RepID=UPI001FB50E81|nr:hypothetical protein [Haemophilus parainfluenzae]DAS61031.1 MAG TPA: hypothetical protein [Caudoviricetes sp.]DAX31375.1 MAG TPA: hypothetical protein [Caudoviricetes sp.]DAX38179.1 MAG TPA: hypothetical protein [Caudoviricetes sp.]